MAPWVILSVLLAFKWALRPVGHLYTNKWSYVYINISDYTSFPWPWKLSGAIHSVLPPPHPNSRPGEVQRNCSRFLLILRKGLKVCGLCSLWAPVYRYKAYIWNHIESASNSVPFPFPQASTHSQSKRLHEFRMWATRRQSECQKRKKVFGITWFLKDSRILKVTLRHLSSSEARGPTSQHPQALSLSSPHCFSLYLSSLSSLQ